MPLVTFSRSAYITPTTGDVLTPPLNKFKHYVNLPRLQHNKHWVLRSVHVTQKIQTAEKDEVRMRYVEIAFPQLMKEDSVFYFRANNHVVNPDPIPNKALRFYPTSASHDQAGFDNHTTIVSVCPDIHFGSKRLDENFLEMEISAKDIEFRNSQFIGVTFYEIILEYN